MAYRMWGPEAESDPRYGQLARAIVAQAIMDYRDAVRMIRRKRNEETARIMIREVERFLRSPWAECLVKIPGERILKLLKEESENDRKRVPKPRAAARSLDYLRFKPPAGDEGDGRFHLRTAG